MLSARIRAARREKKMTQKQVAAALNIDQSTYSGYETGKRQPTPTTISKIAALFGVTGNYLLGIDDEQAQAEPAPETHASNLLPFPEMPMVPIVGRVACGKPITAEENIEGYTGLPSEWGADFILICQGASMEPKIMDGDAVAIKKVEEVLNGQIAAVRIGDEATLKKVYRYPDRLELRPINTDFEPIILWREEMNNAAIEGRAVGLCRGI